MKASKREISFAIAAWAVIACALIMLHGAEWACWINVLQIRAGMWQPVPHDGAAGTFWNPREAEYFARCVAAFMQ